MKDLYLNAEMDVVEFENEDVIATSRGMIDAGENLDDTFGNLH